MLWGFVIDMYLGLLATLKESLPLGDTDVSQLGGWSRDLYRVALFIFYYVDITPLVMFFTAFSTLFIGFVLFKLVIWIYKLIPLT